MGLVLVLRSAHGEELPQTLACVRASRRVRTSDCMRPHASRRIAAVLSCAGICARLRCDAPQHEGTPARARNLTTLCRHADGCPRSMLREELGPINSGLCAALAIIATCGFHGTLACALTSWRRARPSRARASSRIGRTTPSHRRLLQLEGLQQEISTV